MLFFFFWKRKKKCSSKNGLVAWGRKAPLIQLFLFLFFNLLLKLLPAELCCISSVVRCDGSWIGGYCNLNILGAWGGNECLPCLISLLSERGKKNQVSFQSRLINEGYQWWQIKEYVYMENATPVTKTLKFGSLIVTLIFFFMCRGRKIDEMVTKMQFYFESISFKVQCVPTESFSFFPSWDFQVASLNLTYHIAF